MVCVMVSVIIVRASYPRYKYDKLVKLCWNEYVIMVLGWCMWEISVKGVVLG